MISIARILGAPVMEPPGKQPAMRSHTSQSSRKVPTTVETRCSTVSNRSTSQRPVTRTVPGLQDREISFRSKSTIMTFSARSFSLVESSSLAYRSAMGDRGRRRVPLIGRVSTCRCRSTLRNLSGDALMMENSAVVSNPQNGAGLLHRTLA